MKKHTYSGYISFGYTVESDTPLDTQGIIDAIDATVYKNGIEECDLGDIDHYIDGELQEEY